MRPLTVMQLLPALAGGGVERSTLEIADALVAAGHRSLVVSAGGRLVAELERGGSTHVPLDLGRKSLATLRHARTFRALLERERPDIVHARSRLPAWIAWLALRGMRAPRPRFVTSVHGLNSPGWYSGSLTRGEQVICVSATVRDHVLQHWPDAAPRLRVVENGIDPSQFPRAAPRSRADGERVRLLLPGRGTRLKGHAAAIALLAALQRAGHDAELRLLGAREPGRDAYLSELEVRAAELGVADRLRIEPPIAGIAGAYAEADVVLQLSTQPESFGRTVLEALSVGVPVIGWDLGGVGELLGRHFPAGRVPPFDARALAATTIGVLEAGPLDAGARPGPLAARSLAQMQQETLEVYESVAG